MCNKGPTEGGLSKMTGRICPILGTTQWVLSIAAISPGNVFTLPSDKFSLNKHETDISVF